MTLDLLARIVIVFSGAFLAAYGVGRVLVHLGVHD